MGLAHCRLLPFGTFCPCASSPDPAVPSTPECWPGLADAPSFIGSLAEAAVRGLPLSVDSAAPGRLLEVPLLCRLYPRSGPLLRLERQHEPLCGRGQPLWVSGALCTLRPGGRTRVAGARMLTGPASPTRSLLIQHVMVSDTSGICNLRGNKKGELLCLPSQWDGPRARVGVYASPLGPGFAALTLCSLCHCSQAHAQKHHSGGGHRPATSFRVSEVCL